MGAAAARRERNARALHRHPRERYRWETPPDRRTLDLRTIDGPFTPADKFATTQHYGHPTVDPATFKLKISGLVNTPKMLSLDDLKKLGSTDLVVGFECSGNRGPLNGLSGNGRWTGVPLKTVLNTAGVKAGAHDIVFFGADHGEEEVEWRTEKYKVDYHFGRSLPRDKALGAEPFVAWALNGAAAEQAPGRSAAPAGPGLVRCLEREMAVRDSRPGGEVRRQVPDALVPNGAHRNGGRRAEVGETEVTHMQLKSFVARVTAAGGAHKVLAVVLNDGTPIKSVEVKVDDGAWQAATPDTTTKEKFGWKFYTYTWNGATPGEHTIVSRVTDATGLVQPTAEELGSKRSFLETNSQAPRKVRSAR